MKIKVLTHCYGFIESEIPDDFEFLRVTLMTGDEIIEIYCKDPKWGDPYLYGTLDLDSENRTRNFFDATYIVRKDQIEIWNERRDSYNIWEKNKFERLYDGYVGRY